MCLCPGKSFIPNRLLTVTFVVAVTLRCTITAKLFTTAVTIAYRQLFLQHQEVFIPSENGRGLSCMKSTQLCAVQTSSPRQAVRYVDFEHNMDHVL